MFLSKFCSFCEICLITMWLVVFMTGNRKAMFVFDCTIVFRLRGVFIRRVHRAEKVLEEASRMLCTFQFVPSLASFLCRELQSGELFALSLLELWVDIFCPRPNTPCRVKSLASLWFLLLLQKYEFWVKFRNVIKIEEIKNNECYDLGLEK